MGKGTTCQAEGFFRMPDIYSCRKMMHESHKGGKDGFFRKII